jgi:hypothetical protein
MNYHINKLDGTLLELLNMLKTIVIKPGPGVDPAKGQGPGFHGSTWVNSGQPGLTRKNKKKLKF